MNLPAAALSLCLLVPTSPARAANPGGNTGGKQGAGAGDCGADAEKLCPGIAPGSGLRAECLQKHLSEISEGCRRNHPEWTAPPPSDARGPWREACGDAFEQNCAKTEPATAKAIGACMMKTPEKTREAWPAACRAMIKRRAPAAKPKAKPKKKQASS